MKDLRSLGNAKKGDKLIPFSLQLTAEEMAQLDALVQAAKDSEETIYTKRIGRADIVRGLLLACRMSDAGLKLPVRKLAIGELDDHDGDCVACGGSEYNPVTRNIHNPCPLCDGKGTHLLGA